jgi:hypothetical protein
LPAGAGAGDDSEILGRRAVAIVGSRVVSRTLDPLDPLATNGSSRVRSHSDTPTSA